MTVNRRYVLALVPLMAAVLTSCSEVVEPVRRQASLAMVPRAYSCYDPTDPHCSPTPPPGDPNPSAAGVYLGPDFSWTACTSGASDGDHDGIGDFCEYQLALSFRPQLSTNPYDYHLSREPYWAATVVSDRVRIAYLFAYHFDPGNTFSAWCASYPWSHMCAGHLGDSEFVILELYFNPTTQHWITWWAGLSQHGSVWGALALEHPLKVQWYPRIYVARDKHANYATRSDCDNGGAVGSDSCEENVDTDRLYVGLYRNVGSASYRFIDQTSTTENPILYPGTEWFWNPAVFCGWSLPRVTCASTTYSSVLNEWGFANN